MFFILFSRAVTREESLTDLITFRKYSIQAGEKILIKHIQPRTSIIFKRLPQAHIEARSFVNGSAVPFAGTNETLGFDSGAHAAELELTAREPGNLSFFAVTFPDDCETRIVSSHRADVIHGENSQSKVCYFNGAHPTLDYHIQVQADGNGRLESRDLGLALRGHSHNDLRQANASVIAWSGGIHEVVVAVHGGRTDGRGIFAAISGAAGQLIERSAARAPSHFHHHWHFTGLRRPRAEWRPSDGAPRAAQRGKRGPQTRARPAVRER
jgi:hypothetical protein